MNLTVFEVHRPCPVCKRQDALYFSDEFFHKDSKTNGEIPDYPTWLCYDCRDTDYQQLVESARELREKLPKKNNNKRFLVSFEEVDGVWKTGTVAYDPPVSEGKENRIQELLDWCTHNLAKNERPGWSIKSNCEIYRNPETGQLTEVRRNEDGSLDEVVSNNIHIEQMDDNAWWMSVNGIHINFTTKRAKISSFVEPNGDVNSEKVSEDTIKKWSEEPT